MCLARHLISNLFGFSTSTEFEEIKKMTESEKKRKEDISYHTHGCSSKHTIIISGQLTDAPWQIKSHACFVSSVRHSLMWPR